MTLQNYRCRQVHQTLNGVNPLHSFRDMRSTKSGSNLWQIWQVFGPWASPYGANGQMTITVHNYRPRKFHRTSNGENPSSGCRDMGSASLAAARRPTARTVTTIPLQPGGLKGKNANVKVMAKVKIWGIVFNWYIFFRFVACNLFLRHGNPIFDLDNSRSRSWPARSKSMVTFEATF